jgi:hypothetical protein
VENGAGLDASDTTPFFVPSAGFPLHLGIPSREMSQLVSFNEIKVASYDYLIDKSEVPKVKEARVRGRMNLKNTW